MATNLRLDWATPAAARYACERWHYSNNLPTGKSVRIGVWENGKFIGAIVFNGGATPNLSKPYKLGQTEVCELSRVALGKHASSVTRIISIAIKFLKQRSPGLRLIVSFADPFRGHYGGVYQGGNWIYSGLTSPDRYYSDAAGKLYHARQVSEAGNIKKQFGRRVNRLDSRKLTKIIMPGKHRYLMPLDDDMRKRVEPLRKPYPKRAVSKENVAVSHQDIGGGVNPTTALHSIK